ncbi:MAG: phosphopantothenate/pantothenate synthetase [Candidatus Thermoplasmatota archaeon]|nr:phosphopantothenate/pantothenate synthetase [Candidatus Thermoplasmatota archaeon]
MAEIPESHPRKVSLMARQSLVDAAAEGLLADSAMIAHGRGEAFDYLLGEVTSDSARLAIREVAARLLDASSPTISVNGNTVVLAGHDLIRVAAVVGCPIEINLYYRTPERVSGLLSRLKQQAAEVAHGPAPKGWQGDWGGAVASVSLLGSSPDDTIPELDGPRSVCCSEGIGGADSVLVPLEDGDRCEALVKMGKQVLVIDLNPLSRTAMTATVTVVDEVSRAASILLSEVVAGDALPTDWDNTTALKDALNVMAQASV